MRPSSSSSKPQPQPPWWPLNIDARKFMTAELQDAGSLCMALDLGQTIFGSCTRGSFAFTASPVGRLSRIDIIACRFKSLDFFELTRTCVLNSAAPIAGLQYVNVADQSFIAVKTSLWIDRFGER
jgi:hypothetical protein